jgi:hypothetical protein
MNKALIGLAVSAAALGTTSATAACVQFEIVGNGVDRHYDPFKPTLLNDNFMLRIKRLNPNATSVRFLIVDTTAAGARPVFGAGGPADYGVEWVSDTSRPVFFTGAQTLNDTNGATARFSGNQDSATTVFRVSVPPGQATVSGRLHEQFALRFQCYAGSSRIDTESEQRSGLTEYALRVPRTVAAFIGGTDRGMIDFGVLGLNPVLSRTIMVTAQATVPYAIDISTDNGFNLQGTRGAPGTIGYDVTIASVAVDRPATLRCPATPIPGGQQHPVQVTLRARDVRSQPAGDYGDVITLTFRTDEGYSAPSCTLARVAGQ